MNYLIKNITEINEREISNFYNKISILKKNKIDKLKNNKSKLRSIIGEKILYELLKKNNIKYNNIKFYINDYGKPYIKDIDLFYNISHSFEYVITIISNKEIGIDIEKIRKTPVSIINQFATKKEKAYILSDKNIIEKRIFQIYTLKEAYFKMLGTNLNHILEVEFTIINDDVYCSDKNVKAGFLKDLDEYIIAYCEKI